MLRIISGGEGKSRKLKNSTLKQSIFYSTFVTYWFTVKILMLKFNRSAEVIKPGPENAVFNILYRRNVLPPN